MPSGASRNLRLFFAVPLAEELRERARELQRDLARADAKVKWVEQANLHMTLKFIGEVAAERLGEFRRVAEQVAARASCCEPSVRGVGCFLSRGAPRTIWLGVEGEARELCELAERLDGALVEAGLAEPERRRFAPHFTLGRVKGQQNARELLAAIEELSEAPVGPMRVESFALMSSELTPCGPVYTEEARFGLGPRTAKLGHGANNAQRCR